MKKNYLFILLIAFSTYAQKYTLISQTSAYSNLTSTTSINNDVPWDDDLYDLTLPFPFKINNISIANWQISSNGTLWGRTSTPDIDTALTLINSDLADLNLFTNNPSASPISYKIEGATGSRVLKIQFLNASFLDNGNISGNQINFQVWLYETSNIIEYRYGPSNASTSDLANNNGNYIGLATIDWLNFNVLDSHTITSLSNPALSLSPNPVTLLGTPANGTVYRFTPINLGINENELNENNFISLYPNPTSSILYLKTNDNSILDKISIMDLTGRTVLEQKESVSQINLNNLPSGIYILQAFSGDKIFQSKFVKE